jgi:hypothetical protein
VENKGKWKGFAWAWRERLEPKKARVPNPAVLAVRVANLGQKDLLLNAEPVKFFTEPHYNGYPAILVKIAEVTVADLRMLLEEAWRCQAPAAPKKKPKPATTRGAKVAEQPARSVAKRTVAKRTVAKRTVAKRTEAKPAAPKRASPNTRRGKPS